MADSQLTCGACCGPLGPAPGTKQEETELHNQPHVYSSVLCSAQCAALVLCSRQKIYFAVHQLYRITRETPLFLQETLTRFNSELWTMLSIVIQQISTVNQHLCKKNQITRPKVILYEIYIYRTLYNSPNCLEPVELWKINKLEEKDDKISEYRHMSNTGNISNSVEP